MSQSNYSKVEKGVIDIPFTKMIELLDRLGMTIDEFLYIHHNYKKIPGKQLKRINQLRPGDKSKIIENINELKAISKPTQRQAELLAIFEALNLISNDDYEAASHKVSIIWERLKKHDTWYLYDIRLINSILYLFPIDTAGSIVNLVLKRLENYKHLGNIHKLSANIQINYLLLLIKNDEYNLALSTAERLIDFSINHQLYTHLAVSYVRKGIILKNLNESDPSMWYDKGFELLKVTNNQNMIQELNKEVQLYTDG
ncbi:transcriptional regulator [Alkalibacterium kapii]|uniref:Transcriptional regulator n=2 Tax=Alkalibacterium kapii TaxID=426704 RepID=A0A511ASM3_9LACT|nr:transcriptional regulator [Alkalibacterium kapii]